jgi:predicted Zn-ribbon and HTH transcriptional regulator
MIYKKPDLEWYIPKEKWNIHQIYNKPMEEVKQIRCKKCNGTQFEVMKDDCFTGIRCPICKWELCIHEG